MPKWSEREMESEAQVGLAQVLELKHLARAKFRNLGIKKSHILNIHHNNNYHNSNNYNSILASLHYSIMAKTAKLKKKGTFTFIPLYAMEI